MHIIEHQS